MKMTFRWYGNDDPVTLDQIRQIPGMNGVVSAIYDIPVGKIWPIEKIKALRASVEAKGLKLNVIESVPVHEDIKMGKGRRDEYIANYCKTIENLASEGIDCICYNFMPVFDWTRSELSHLRYDGSSCLSYDNQTVLDMDPVKGELSLPGWDSSYTKDQMKALLDEYASITEDDLWDNLAYFLKPVIATCDKVGVNMAIHPDDPPWGIFGLPRIIKNKADIVKLYTINQSKHNGLTLCTGSLGANPDNDLVDIANTCASRIHFVHLRNVKITGEKCFEESGHLSNEGSLDMYAITKALVNNGFDGYVRPDHGRMIWDETGKPGYGLFDRALGAAYINGLFEAAEKNNKE